MLTTSQLAYIIFFISVPCSLDNCVDCNSDADECDVCADGYDTQTAADEGIRCMGKT